MVQDTTPVEVDGQRRSSLFNFSSIGTRLVFTIVVLVLVPAALIAAVTVYNDIQSGRQQSLNQLESVATLKDAQLSNWVAELEEELAREINDRTLSLIPFVLPDSGFSRVQEDSITRLRELFQQSIVGEGRYEEVFLINLDGRVLVSSNEDSEGTVFSDMAAIEQSLQGPYVGPIRFGESFETTYITLLQPVYERDELVAIIGGYANLNQFNAIMAERSGLGDTGETYLVDANLMLVTDSRFEGYPLGATMVNTDAVQNAIESQGRGEASYDDYRGEAVFGVYHWIPELEVTLVAQRDQSEALSSTFTTLRANVAVAAIAIVVAIIVGYLFVRTISNPLTELTKTATRIASGNLQVTAPIQRGDEIGSLSKAFNSMTTQLSELINTLEERVTARTRDLQVASNVSRQVTTVLDLDELLPQLVELTREGFGLYHVSVFLYDEANGRLELAAGTGEAGRRMKESGKMFHISDIGLVPRSIRERNVVLVNDVTTSQDYFADPNLPETRSELALPMRLGSEMVGVLDLQSALPNRFTEEELDVLTTLGEQIAVAVRNAQLFAQAEYTRREAEQANRIKSQFLANMSHELRTPLNAILNFTEFVSEGTLGPVNEKQVTALHKAVSSGEHLLSLINDVLDITKIEVGMMELFIEDIDLNALLESVLSTAHGLMKEKPLELITEIEPDMPTIAIDKRRIRQILINLISNAVKFTNEGSITLRAFREANTVHITVEDTGIGISPEELPLVFETFRQAASGGLLPEMAGTGLGLPISKHFAEAHNGQLWLESEEGVGTTAHLILQIETEQERVVIATGAES